MAETQATTIPGVTPYLYGRAFAAVEEMRHPADDNKRLLHGRLAINGALVMLSHDFPDYNNGVETAPPAAVTLHLQVDDADVWWERAVAAGATVRMPLADQFWGDRYGQLTDPFGHRWSIGGPKKG